MAARLLRNLASASSLVPVALRHGGTSCKTTGRVLALTLPASLAVAQRLVAEMSGFNLLHLVTKSQPVALKACGLPSGTCRGKKTWPVSFPPEELKKRLSPMQYHVTQERGTESAFTGKYTDNKEKGIYTCVVCGSPLFKSETKFNSGSGWPSFYDLVKEEAITVTDDFTYGMHRVETSCSQCGSHLGHLFDDGPRPTGKRYCINSASLGFRSDTQVAPGDDEGAGASGGEASGKAEL